MSLLQPKTVEEYILQTLARGPKKATELLEDIRALVAVTKQGFYAALRKLKAEETIVIYKGEVSLNTAWIKGLDDRVQEMRVTYLQDAGEGVFALREGESLSYRFTNTKHLDVFWGHTQNVLVSQIPVTEPVYSYDPHYWFYIARPETEKKLVADIVREGRQFLMTVGGSSPLDASIREDFSDDVRQYHMERVFDRNNYYVVVIGNYITEVILDLNVANKVDVIYATATNQDEQTIEKLRELLTVKARHKIKVSRNSRKARELKRKLGKNFFIHR